MAFGFSFYFETGSPNLVLASFELKGTFLPSKSLFTGLFLCSVRGNRQIKCLVSQVLGLQE